MSGLVKMWLSFADANLPEGQQFLGACIVEVKRFDDWKDTIRAALKKAHILSINPGGSVKSLELPDDAKIHPSWFDVLLDKKTIKEHDSVEGWSKPRPGNQEKAERNPR